MRPRLSPVCVDQPRAASRQYTWTHVLVTHCLVFVGVFNCNSEYHGLQFHFVSVRLVRVGVFNRGSDYHGHWLVCLGVFWLLTV
jgi:hypothetical membrane protein